MSHVGILTLRTNLIMNLNQLYYLLFVQIILIQFISVIPSRNFHVRSSILRRKRRDDIKVVEKRTWGKSKGWGWRPKPPRPPPPRPPVPRPPPPPEPGCRFDLGGFIYMGYCSLQRCDYLHYHGVCFKTLDNCHKHGALFLVQYDRCFCCVDPSSTPAPLPTTTPTTPPPPTTTTSTTPPPTTTHGRTKATPKPNGWGTPAPPPTKRTTTRRTTTAHVGWGAPTTTKKTGWGPGIDPIIPDIPAKDCCELFGMGYKKCGIYQIRPHPKYKAVVYCDMTNDGGGWTVLTRREPTDGPSTNFYLNNKSYVFGFGRPSTTYWLGLKIMADLVQDQDQELKVCLETYSGENYQGTYQEFFIDRKDNYRLQIGQFSGNMDDALGKHNNQIFHAPDTDRTDLGCSQLNRAGWWFHNEDCYDALLTGKYKKDSEASKVWSEDDTGYGIIWNGVTNKMENGVRTDTSLKYALMKIRTKSGCGFVGPDEAETSLIEYTDDRK